MSCAVVVRSSLERMAAQRSGGLSLKQQVTGSELQEQQSGILCCENSESLILRSPGNYTRGASE